MPPPFPFAPPPPPLLAQRWGTRIVIIGSIFLITLFVFDFFDWAL
jgi:hypothetical protein